MVAVTLLLAVGSLGGTVALQPEAAELARLLGLKRSLDALRAGTVAPGAGSAREEVTRRVLQAGFEADSAIAQIQEEQAAVAEVLSALQADRDARVGTLNLGAGVFAAGASMKQGLLALLESAR